jgi:hypothetical protein
MMCRGSSRVKICHAFQSGRPAANVAAPSPANHHDAGACASALAIARRSCQDRRL